MRFFLLIGAAASLCLTGSLHAFPPAPYYTLYGIVRDQVGQTLNVDGAQLILLKAGEEIGRTPITRDLLVDQNYEISVRLDMARNGTQLYSSAAVPALGEFSLSVEMNGQSYYPIEVSGNLTAGRGGERVRLDLNLGEDLDHDGLPDIWEQWQLYQAGYYPDGGGNWPLHLIDKNGDFDHDGVSNWTEYVAGTFAGDATERFVLDIKEKLSDSVRFEFFAITGKTYSIERSTDMQVWSRIPFRVGDSTIADEIFRSPDVAITPASAVPAQSAAKEFYRLTVR